MAEKLVMLALSPTMEKGTITRWLIQEGERIGSGDPICEVETDKTTMEYEAPAEGTLLKILTQAGETVGVGAPIAIIGEEGEDFAALIEEAGSTRPAPAGADQPPPENATAPRKPTKGETALGGRLPGGVPASPLARRMAEEQGIDLMKIEGSGPGGRIVRRDIERVQHEEPRQPVPTVTAADSGDQLLAVTGKRKVIAERLAESARTAPHYYLTAVAGMEALQKLREEANLERKSRLSLNAFLLRLTAAALRKHPLVNASWQGNSILLHDRADIALAVAQTDGLVTPVIRTCESKGVEQIDKELREKIERAREGRLAPEEYADGTFTVSNLGSYGIRQFTAIINPPQAAILAVGSIVRQPVAGPNDEVIIRPQMTLTLSCDHRVLDGAVAAAFLRDLVGMIERPVGALL